MARVLIVASAAEKMVRVLIVASAACSAVIASESDITNPVLGEPADSGRLKFMNSDGEYDELE